MTETEIILSLEILNHPGHGYSKCGFEIFQFDVKEVIYIKLEQPTLNRRGDPRHHSSATYNAVLTSLLRQFMSKCEHDDQLEQRFTYDLNNPQSVNNSEVKHLGCYICLLELKKQSNQRGDILTNLNKVQLPPNRTF